MSESRMVPVAVPVGRMNICRVYAIPVAVLGVTQYVCQVNPGTSHTETLTLPVQSHAYHHPKTGAKGIPPEALYAILRDALEQEHGTVCDSKQRLYTLALQRLDESLRYVAEADSLPAANG